ncbi:putative hydrolase of the HAD superfamily [Natranaerovirga pectinivora]|uniref:Putative hydrolase of the HAD superfamily n=1 Tax=Natranaerovirga pectinivora TaxID=682400 RepID=A0A4R3MPP5_9FIRM|nr:HAD family hydrolase [Natranaerovirga pectinivora]TCT17211.1 putative hydrolase of the HAD superfamily [Natranaerovirga pectinivora]
MSILIWDFDNTLAYRDGMWTKSLYEVLKRNDFIVSEDDIRPHFQDGFPWHRHKEVHKDYFNGLSWWEYVNTIILNALLKIGIEKQSAIELTRQFKDEYLDISKWYLFEDTVRTLEKSISEEYSNYILSNHTPELIDIIEGLGIQKYFKKIISSAVVGYEKPNKLIFEEVSKHFEKDLKVYMIGDSYSADIQGALNYGFEAILVRQENKANYKNYSSNLDGIWEFI